MKDVKSTKLPELIFVLKDKNNDTSEVLEVLEYPFQALGGIPSVGDLIKLRKGLHRIYLRRFDYSNLKSIRIHFYVIKVIE